METLYTGQEREMPLQYKEGEKEISLQQTEFHTGFRRFNPWSSACPEGHWLRGFKAFFGISGFGLTGDENIEAKKLSKKL